jgi:outer membrane protein TolC
MKQSTAGRLGAIATSALVALAAATSLHAQQPAAAPPGAVAPSASASASGFEAKTPPAALADQRFLDALAARPGGLKADEVARRAEMTSPEVRAKMLAVEGAAAKVDQAAVAFAPRLTLSARYVRLSPITYGSLTGGGYIVGTQSAGPLPVICPPPGSVPADQPVQCTAMAAGVSFSFPTPPVNMYSLQAGLALPLSDYVLRLTQNYASASKSRRAAEASEKAARVKAQRDARLAYHNWVRARGGLVVSEQGLATVQAHLKDVAVAVQVGSASKADFMRVESQVAATELLVERTRNMVALIEEQLRVMMHEQPSGRYEIGDDVLSPVGPVAPNNISELQSEALDKRIELRAIEQTVESIRQTKKVVQAGYLPRLDAFANGYYQNPNTRYFPQTAEWKPSWDVGVQLSWTVNDTFTSAGQVNEIEAKAQELEAQANQLRDGIRLEVMASYNASKEAQIALETTQRQLAAAEESYRVRRELFRAGRATSVELTDAETDLMRSRLDALNARMDARVAKVNLEHALGRDGTAVK